MVFQCGHRTHGTLHGGCGTWLGTGLSVPCCPLPPAGYGRSWVWFGSRGCRAPSPLCWWLVVVSPWGRSSLISSTAVCGGDGSSPLWHRGSPTVFHTLV